MPARIISTHFGCKRAQRRLLGFWTRLGETKLRLAEIPVMFAWGAKPSQTHEVLFRLSAAILEKTLRPKGTLG